MNVDFQILESQLSETEMALFMMANISVNASLAAGADAQLIISHLRQHAENFEALGQKKAAHMFSAMVILVENASGIKPARY